MAKHYTQEEKELIARAVIEFIKSGRSKNSAFEYLTEKLNRDKLSIRAVYYRTVGTLDIETLEKKLSSGSKRKEPTSSKIDKSKDVDSIIVEYLVNVILNNGYPYRSDFKDLAENLNMTPKEIVDRYKNGLKLRVRNEVRAMKKKIKEENKIQKKAKIVEVRAKTKYRSTVNRAVISAKKAKNSIMDLILLVNRLEEENKMLKLEIEKLKAKTKTT